MQVQLLVERGQDVCTVNLAGKAYVFRRNEIGALVTDITDKPTIDWVSDPRNPSFMPYVLPEKIEKETDNTGNSELGKIGKSELVETTESESCLDNIVKTKSHQHPRRVSQTIWCI